MELGKLIVVVCLVLIAIAFAKMVLTFFRIKF
jgi:hypothetical protein